MSAESSQDILVLYQKSRKSVEILAVVVLRLNKDFGLIHFSHGVATRLRRSQHALWVSLDSYRDHVTATLKVGKRIIPIKSHVGLLSSVLNKACGPNGPFFVYT